MSLTMATMASSGMHNTLSVPTADDNMEISSDAGRADQDIDIDFMGSEHDENDVDWMLQDAASERGNAQADADQPTNDDLMYDDGEDVTFDEEDAMHDDGLSYTEVETEVQDLEVDLDPQPDIEEDFYNLDGEGQQYEQPPEETLVDFETFDKHENEAGLEAQAYQSEQAVDALEDVEETLIEGAGDLIKDQNEQVEVSVDPTSWNEEESHLPTAAPAAIEQSQDQAESYHVEDLQEQRYQEVYEASEPSAATDPVDGHPSKAESEEYHAEDAIQHDWNAVAELDTGAPAAPGVSTDTDGRIGTLHPVTISWTSESAGTAIEYSLFPTNENDDPNRYLLQDSSVASSTLADLFRSCRSVLDDTLTDSVELELYISSLDLTIHEDSAQCHDSSLAQIIEVYVNLSRNDGAHNVPALSLELYTRRRLSAQLRTLFEAASKQSGLKDLFPENSEKGEEDGGHILEESEQEEKDESGPREAEDSLQEGEYEETSGRADGSYDANEQHAQEPREVVSTDIGNPLPDSSTGIGDTTAQEYQSIAQDGFYEEQHEYPEAHEVEHDHTHEAREDGDFQEHNAGIKEDESSASSTIQGETQPDTTHVENDASSETAQQQYEVEEDEQDAPDDGTQITSGGISTTAQANDVSYDFGGEELAITYDDNAFNEADNFNQEFEAGIDYNEDPEFHERPEYDEEDFGKAEATDGHQEWEDEDTQYAQVDAATTQESGTFKVPSSTEDDEDEITFDDDEFALAEDKQTQDAAAQEKTTGSPLGKRARDDEDDGAIDGSDQESKRLKAV